MKTIYENTVNYLELDIQDEDPSSCISEVSCDDTSLISITNDTVLHKFIISTNTLPVGIDSKLVKFTYTVTDNQSNTNESHEYFLIIKKFTSNNSNNNLTDLDITREDLVYYTILDSTDFLECYFDSFRKFPSLDKTDQLTYDQLSSSYNGIANSYFTKIILDNNPSSYTDFMIHLQSDNNDLFDIKYSIDNEVSWISISNNELDTKINIPTGFTSLSIKISWLSNIALDSFGVFYNSTNDDWY